MSGEMKLENTSENSEERDQECPDILVLETREQWLEFLRSFVRRPGPRPDGEKPPYRGRFRLAFDL